MNTLDELVETARIISGLAEANGNYQQLVLDNINKLDKSILQLAVIELLAVIVLSNKEFNQTLS